MEKNFKYTKPNTFLLIASLVLFLFIVCTSVILPGLEGRMGILKQKNIVKDDKYTVRLREKLENEESVLLKDIFDDIDFTNAYVIHKTFSNGSGLKKLYNLDISIDENNVKGTDKDFIRRIVFVDENKEVVFNWEYNVNKVFILEGGYYISKDTVIKKEDVESAKLCIRFEGVEKSNYFDVYPADIQELFNESIKDITREELVEENTGIDSTQCVYGDFNFYISPESEEKNQYLYRTTKDGRNAVLILYSEYGINTLSLGRDSGTIEVTVNVMINGVLTNVPVTIDVTEYDRDQIWAQNRI